MSSFPLRRVGALLVATAVSCLGLAPGAQAAAYTKSANAPQKTGPRTLQGTADLSLDCSGTLGCRNYMKIEVQRWNGIKKLSGKWANANGVNSINGKLKKGCYSYRTTVDSYNDMVGAVGIGVNLGPVGATKSGEKVYRFRSEPWSSGWSRLCSG